MKKVIIITKKKKKENSRKFGDQGIVGMIWLYNKSATKRVVPICLKSSNSTKCITIKMKKNERKKKILILKKTILLLRFETVKELRKIKYIFTKHFFKDHFKDLKINLTLFNNQKCPNTTLT